jgi:transcriptional regulator with XRE-family HTH domain
MGFMKAIGEAIKERRGVLSVTQRELAEIAGVGINTLTKIERGEANPSLKTLQSILNALGLEMKIGIRQ